MKTRPLRMLLAVAAMLASTASCTCSGDHSGSGAASGSGTTGTAEPALKEQSFKLPNGLQVDLASGPCGDSAALVVVVGVGIDHDPDGRSGMAHLAERVLATTAAAGHAERSVETGGDYTLYSVVAAGDRLLEEIDDVAAWMSKTAPTEADLAREKPKLVDELGKLSGIDAAGTAVRYAEEAVRPTSGNGRRRGIPAEVEAITLAELQAFWQAGYKPGAARIVVAGRFDAQKVRARIEAAMGPLPAGTPPATRAPGDTTVKGTLVMGEAPKAVAIGVPVPAASDALFAPFLMLAARLLDKPAQPRTWDVTYDPIRRPDLLLITGPVGQAEQPEPAAGRMRNEVSAILARPPTKDDAEKARQTFRLFLEQRLDDAALCATDARAFAIARARRAQLGLDTGPIDRALDATTKEQLDEAAKLFEPKRSAAVIAGGAIAAPPTPPSAPSASARPRK